MELYAGISPWFSLYFVLKLTHKQEKRKEYKKILMKVMAVEMPGRSN